MTEKQATEWFKWHEPTQEKQVQYDALHAAREALRGYHKGLEQWNMGVPVQNLDAMHGVPSGMLPHMEDVRGAAEQCARAMEDIAPACADTTYAIRRVRVVAFALNTAISMINRGAQPGAITRLLLHAGMSLDETAWFANVAVATDGA
jgi:hypothetical protein